ncbi:MAG: MgtC/SapB family protein [Oligoflexia bacterium]|nr:MgtC/SapB family protein [Oligoflexia bacterium]
MLSIEDTISRLIIAAFLGAIIGFEREKNNQPAGLRTHIILTIGATIAMCVSINISAQYQSATGGGDPGRIAAQVISGIGFLGAGAIFRFGTTIKGLTTATSLWTMAIIGLAVGAGYFILSIIGTLLVLIVLIVLQIFEKKLISTHEDKVIFISAIDRSGFVDEIRELLTKFSFVIHTIGISKDMEQNLIEIEAVAKIPPKHNVDQMVGMMSKMEGIKKFTLR